MSSSWWKLKHGVYRTYHRLCYCHSHCVLTSKSRTTLKLRILDPCLGEALNSVHSHFLLQHLNFGLESHNSWALVHTNNKWKFLIFSDVGRKQTCEIVALVQHVLAGVCELLELGSVGETNLSHALFSRIIKKKLCSVFASRSTGLVQWSLRWLQEEVECHSLSGINSDRCMVYLMGDEVAGPRSRKHSTDRNKWHISIATRLYVATNDWWR
jgi:hypothetical protein